MCCVDEAGHATEPEVIGVAASLMDFKRPDSQVGQMILAGDPKQLGPVITSDLCQKFGLSVSYMERLTGIDVYSRDEGGTYPPDLLMKLVRTYRSHPVILKLPNEMFYDNELLACGDIAWPSGSTCLEKAFLSSFMPSMARIYEKERRRRGSTPKRLKRLSTT